MKKLRSILGIFLILALCCINYSPAMLALREVPDIVWKGENQAYRSLQSLGGILSVNDGTTQSVSFSGDESLGKTTKTQVEIKLFDWIPLKRVQVCQRDELWVTPGGHSIGVTLYTQGALVVGMSDVSTTDGARLCPGAQAGLQPGDYITAVNGSPVDTPAQITEQCSQGGELILDYTRDGQVMQTTIQPVLDTRDQQYRLGLWMRNSTMGIGTLTFYDPISGWYAALGHAIMDIDTGTLLTVREGRIMASSVVDVIQGERGAPGELRGFFNGSNQLYGYIQKNNSFGVYGSAESLAVNPLYPDGIAVAYPQEVQLGPAQLLTTLDEGGIQAFDCKVIRVNPQTEPGVKGMVIEVTDSELLSRTGGIIQGMSGSPLIQNGKLIGAVTHVFINDPAKGYCMYALWMLEQTG